MDYHGQEIMATDSRLKRYAHLLRQRRYPVWSVRSAAVVALFVLAISAGLQWVLGSASIFHRIELTLGVCGVAMFGFLAIGLHRGARVKRKDLPATQWTSPMTLDDALGSGPDLSSGLDLPVDWMGEGCLGAIVAFVLWLVVLLFAGVILWALLELGFAVVVGFSFGLCWVLYRALRRAFALSRKCRGDWPRSLTWASVYTVLYLGWLWALLLVGAWLIGRRGI